MKHVFRFLWWAIMGSLLILFGTAAFAIIGYVLYPLWNFRWYKSTNHTYPENLSWREILHDWPIEVWQRAIGTYREPEPLCYQEQVKSLHERWGTD